MDRTEKALYAVSLMLATAFSVAVIALLVTVIALFAVAIISLANHI